MEIREEDLQIRTCPHCNGERLVWDPPVMPRQGGTQTQINCPECGGRGVKLTPTGALLFDFVQKVRGYSRYT